MLRECWAAVPDRAAREAEGRQLWWKKRGEGTPVMVALSVLAVSAW